MFLVLFVWQRSRSTALQIEAERDVAELLAESGRDEHPAIRTADVMALRDLCGIDADRDAWQDKVTEFAERLGMAEQMLDLGGMVPLAPEGPVAERVVALAVRDMTGDEIAVCRFLVLRERFAEPAGTH